MKTYLTKTGLLVVRDDASFFTSNNGEFRRLATDDEVEHLKEVLEEVFIERHDPHSLEIRTRLLYHKLTTMKIPMWHYLWQTKVDDYTHYKAGTCNNGGDYSYHEYKDFFIRCIDSQRRGRRLWEVRVLKTYSTSAEFSYDELNQSFQSNLQQVEIVGIAPAYAQAIIAAKKGETYKKDEWVLNTQTSSGEEEQIVLDQLLDNEVFTVEEAINAFSVEYPQPTEDDDDPEEIYLFPTEKEVEKRKEILKVIGYEEQPIR